MAGFVLQKNTFLSIEDLESIIDKKIKENKEKEHPIGDLEFNVSGTNPNEYLGFGTWELWGEGKVPVGIDINDNDFKTVEKTGGNKLIENLLASGSSYGGLTGGANSGEYRGRVLVTPSGDINSQPTARDINRSIVQPYITCYMWKRVN